VRSAKVQRTVCSTQEGARVRVAHVRFMVFKHPWSRVHGHGTVGISQQGSEPTLCVQW